MMKKQFLVQLLVAVSAGTITAESTPLLHEGTGREKLRLLKPHLTESGLNALCQCAKIWERLQDPLLDAREQVLCNAQIAWIMRNVTRQIPPEYKDQRRHISEIHGDENSTGDQDNPTLEQFLNYFC